MKILVPDSLAPEGLALFKNADGFEVDVKLGLKPDELKKICADYDGWVIRSGTKITAELIEAAKNLKVIGRAGVGFENIDVDAASKRGIVVMNTPGGNNVTTGEHTISLMMALARHIPQAVASLKSGQWDRNKFVGVELCNKTIGIIGLGNVGRIVAERAAGLRMKVIGYDPFILGENIALMGVEPASLEEIFIKSDFITVHVPLTSETQGLINREAFAKMKPGVRIINCARGGIVDEKDLADAIREGKVAGAALDVYVDEPPPAGHPLVKMDQVITTPHLGASTDEAQLNVATAVAEQMVESRGERSGDFASSITIKAKAKTRDLEVEGAIFGSKHPRIVRVNNFYLEAVPEGYILILHNKDVPGVVGTVGTLLGKNGINIAGMELGRSEKGGNAISFIHVDDGVSKKALEELRAPPQIVSADLVKL